MDTSKQTTIAGAVAGVFTALVPVFPSAWQWLPQFITAVAIAFLGQKAKGV